MDNFGFLKVAAAVPHVRIADCDYNTGRMEALAEEAARRGVEIVAFPELSVTAYTCGDLVLQPTLLDAADEALERLVRATRKLPLTLIAGAPLRHGSALYNCAVVFTQGKVLGVVPKTYIPNYGEFYENRWFAWEPGFRTNTSSSRAMRPISAPTSRSRSTARNSASKSARTSGPPCRPRRSSR